MVFWGDPNEDPLARIRMDYLEMPELRVTEAQARRLWGLDAGVSRALLNLLVDAHFLCRARDGAYVRADAQELLRRAG